ncbi:MAG: prepilin-type N-terminal cleavage/methylation domain-containing protein [Gemmatimonadota bacterium]
MSGTKRSGRLHGLRRTTRDGRGFTLIEVMVSMVIFAILVTGVAGIMMGIVRADRNSTTRTSSAFYMQELIEDARILDYAALASGNGTRSIGGGASLRADWTVTEIVAGKLKQVDFKVRRIPPLGNGDAERAVRLYIANRNP